MQASSTSQSNLPRRLIIAILGLVAGAAVILLAMSAGASAPLCIALACIVALVIALRESHTQRAALEQRMTEEVQRRSERLQYFLQRLIDVIPEPVYVKDAEGYYLLINQAFCQQRGQAAREILGRSVRELLAKEPSRVDLVSREDAAVLTGQRVFKEETYRHPYTGEERFRLISKGTCLDANGKPVIVGANFDITDWRRAEQRLQAALDVQSRFGAFLQSVFDAVPSALFVKDSEHRFILTNEAFANSLGVVASELVGKRAHEVMPVGVAGTIEACERRLLEGAEGLIAEEEVELTDAQGRQHPTVVRIVTRCDPQGQRVIIGIHTDLTERRAFDIEVRNHHARLKQLVEEQTASLLLAKETAERSSDAKSHFLANISHELRTPMHAILSFARIGLSGKSDHDTEKLHSYFERITQSGERLLNLVNNLLDLSKLEAGHARLELKPTNLKEVVDGALQEFEALLMAKRMALSQHTTSRMPVSGDAIQLGQVVRNLLSNAIKFSPDGSTLTLNIREASLSAGRRAGEEHRIPAVELSIADQGVGIPPDELECVFDKFVQSSKTSNTAGGTGLGLAICREIVLAHRGHIFARNLKNGGAEFVMRIPIASLASQN